MKKSFELKIPLEEEIYPLVANFLSTSDIAILLEKEAIRLQHIRRSLPLTTKERILRDQLGREQYKKLTPTEKERYLESIEINE